MDSRLFGRKWAVTIGPPGQAGKTWDGLRVTFKVQKSGSAEPNKLDLSIYNLSKESRQAIERKGLAVRLEAGYASNAKLLFTGGLDLVTHDRQGAEWETVIEAADGGHAYRATVLHESFGPDTTESSVIHRLADALGVTIGEIKGLSKEKFAQGRQLSGPARVEIDTLCRSKSLRWSIQDGVLQVLPAGAALGGSAVLLSPSTGLVGSPKKTESGIKVVSLMQGGINPGRLIQVESESIKGLYIAENVVHQGDSHGRDWYTEIECLRAS